jgi:3-oxoadipate CoA-transferase beta subunit
MDLAVGARAVYVIMSLFARDGTPKLVPECSYPLTGLACVSRIYTEHAIFDITEHGVAVVETFGVEPDELKQRLDVPLVGSGGTSGASSADAAVD